MSDASREDFQQLHDEIERLRATVAQRDQQLGDLQKQLSEVNTGLMALNDKHFDGNVYRNALAHDFKEHVYTKIRNLFGAVAIVAGIGGVFFVNAAIDRVVRSTINEQQSQFVDASENLTRERLVFLLREIRDGATRSWMERAPGHDEELRLRAQEIQNEPEFLPYLQEFIKDRTDRYSQALAIHYVGFAREKRLIDPVLAVLEDGRSAEARVQALNTLLQFPTTAEIAEKAQGVLEGEHVRRSPLWSELARTLSLTPVRTASAREFADALMQEALRSQRAEVYRDAVLFYAVNPALWTQAHRREFGAFEEVLAQAVSSIGRSQDANATEQQRLLRQYRALRLLRQGDSGVFSNADLDYPHFPVEIWEELLALFPGFKPQPADAYAYGDERRDLQSLPDDLRQTQIQLWAKLPYFEWDKTRKLYVYNDPQDPSIAALKQGDVEEMRMYLWDAAYEPERWREILDLFPHFRDQPRDSNVFIDESAQYQLSRELHNYVWDGQRRYEYRDPQEASIASLRVGDTSLASGYLAVADFEEEQWRRVLELFPDELARYQQDGLVGISEQQSAFVDALHLQIWNPDSGNYRRGDWQTASIDRLASGDPSAYFDIMENGYYEPDVWVGRVLPLFQNLPDELFEGSPSGTEEEQDLLWGWASDSHQEGQLELSGTATAAAPG